MKQSSTELTRHVDRWVVLTIAALAAIAFYLLICVQTFGLGFPLDDAWIHLTYARNLAEHGEWAFQLGQRSAGSTSPLWTALLSIGFLIHLTPYIWSYLMGWVVLACLSICAENIVRTLLPSYRARLPWAGLFFVFAWHLTWSAVSGMETLLHGLIIFSVLGSLQRGSRSYLTLGWLTGLSAWVRPDGLTLLGPILLVALMNEKTWHARGEAILKAGIGFGSLVLPYLLFNLALSGNAMPNTFYAKQAEYGEFWHSKPLLERITEYLWPVLASPFLALIPAALLWVVKRVRELNWGTIASFLWVLGYVTIYFVSLPAYQHGRYIIPTFPVLYLWGVLGLLEIVLSPAVSRRFAFLWTAVAVALVIAFTSIGARQYASDVHWVESEMVATAEWVNENIPASARLAVHDIGALGYYVDNPIIDMAGLITPDVVPFMRDEDRLAQYLDLNAVDYLITLPSFYPQLTSQSELVFEAGVKSQPGRLGESMGVYRWK